MKAHWLKQVIQRCVNTRKTADHQKADGLTEDTCVDAGGADSHLLETREQRNVPTAPTKKPEYKMSTQDPINPSALERQEGGKHYKNMRIQPVEFCQANGLGYCESSVIKYVCRHKQKNGAEDIRKAIHFLELLLELDYKSMEMRKDKA